MAGKSKDKNNNKSEKEDYRARQMVGARIVFAIFAVILILSMVLSLVVQY
jgi:hypothetical protein